MPELPEVETVMRALAPSLEGKTILSCRIHNSKLREPLTEELRNACKNQKISKLSRRAKFILIALENGSWLISHLGMTGSWRIVPASTPLLKHEHITFELNNNQSWRYSDPRRFGFIRYIKDSDESQTIKSLGDIGPEPLSEDFSSRYLLQFCQNKKKPIKNIIMDMKCVAGVGNIYACESLFTSGIHPEKEGRKLRKKDSEKLIAAIKHILKIAIEAGGTTISDFKNPDGGEGYFFRELQIYGRVGQECTSCRATIEKITQSGRSTFFCPQCQKI